MNHQHIFKKLCCVTCQTTGMFSVTDTQIVCGHCNTNYPFISGQIPVLVKHPEKLLIHAYKEYTSYIGQQQFLISRLKNQVVKSKYRSAETKNRLAKAIEVNTELIEKIKHLIKPYVELDKVLNTPESNELHYLSNFDYIRRDWSGQPRAEAEIDAIKKIIQGFFAKSPPEKENAVFLGAGTGRVAWELKDYFEQTYAIDNSMTMIAMFNELLQHDLELYEINYKNCLKSEEICKPYVASINNSKVSKTQNYFAFVGDASSLPFADASVANMFSVYFTDVLPLKVLIPELKRTLQPNGLFFHFGPLHYHFNDVEEMLTAEEVKDAFIAEGFEILMEDLQDLTHQHSEVSLSVKKFYNWIFAVRKKEVSVIKVHLDMILKMDKGFDYRATGSINSSSKGEEMNYQMLLPSGQRFSGSELILELSRRVDGEKSLNAIITEIESEFDFKIENKQDLLELIEQLIEGNVFKV